MAHITITPDYKLRPTKLTVELGEAVRFHFEAAATADFSDDDYLVTDFGASVSSLKQPKDGRVTLFVNPDMDQGESMKVTVSKGASKTENGSESALTDIDSTGDTSVITVGN